MKTSTLLSTLVLVALCSRSWGQEAPARFPGIRAETAPKIDGDLSPSEWPDAARGEGFFDSDTGNPANEYAEFWLTYDETFIYFAARAKTDPKSLVDDEYRANVNLKGNDTFGVAIDPSGVGNTANNFQVNPSGATSLALAGGRAAKTEWLGEFDATAKKTVDGWQCEARIPWAIMALPDEEVRNLRVNVLWYRSVASGTFAWKYTRDNSSLTPYWEKVEVPRVSKAKTLQLLPYGYAGIDKEGRAITNAGLDLKTDLADNLTLVGTANPDFRNIESAILDLEFSYFERLADEARPFFQEGSRFQYLGFDQKIFAPQRIRDFDTGLNLYGKLSNRTTASILTTLDFGVQQSVVASIGHTPTESLDLRGALAVNVQPGLNNRAINLVATKRVGEWSQYALTQASDDQVEGQGSRTAVGMFREHGGTNIYAETFYVTPKFFPRLGFSPERDFKGFFTGFERETQPKQGTFRTVMFGSFLNYSDRTGGAPYRRSFEAFVNGSLRNRYFAFVSAEVSRFEEFDDRSGSIGFGFNPSPYRGWSVSYGVGNIQSSPFQSVSFSFRLKPTRRSQVSLSNEFLEVVGERAAQQIITASYDLGKYEAIGGRLVRSDDKVGWYLSYRMSGKRGNELFVILGDPRADEFQRQLVLKLVVPVTVRF